MDCFASARNDATASSCAKVKQRHRERSVAIHEGKKLYKKSILLKHH